MKTLAEVTKELAELEAKTEQLRQSKIRLEQAEAALTPDQLLAKRLHELQCTWNHTDGCGWYYEQKNGVDEWISGSTHDGWVKKAIRFRGYCKQHSMSTSQALAVLAFSKDLG